MKMYRCTWECCDYHIEQTPFFRTLEEAKNCFWVMIHKQENVSLLTEIQTYYNGCREEAESLKDFVYAVLDGWDICGYETAEFID